MSKLLKEKPPSGGYLKHFIYSTNQGYRIVTDIGDKCTNQRVFNIENIVPSTKVGDYPADEPSLLICENFINYGGTECIDTIQDGFYCNDTNRKTIDLCHGDCVSCNQGPQNEYSNCNYDQKGSAWEREADLTVFNSDHLLNSEQDLGIRVKGHRSRNFPKKSFNIYSRNIYGTNTLDPDLIGLHKSSASLFTGGNDKITMIVDLLINDMVKGLNFPSVELGDPYYLFLNGEFWGLYRISEKLDEDYINYLYDVKSDNVIIVKDRVLDGGLPGDDEIYGEFHDFYYNADLSQDSEYEKFKEMADIDNFIDYFAARIYVEKCIDWPNSNLALWRARETDKSNPYADGRWRWINFDNNVNLDYDSVSKNTIEIAINGNNNFKRYEPFYNLMRNKDFRKRFYERFVEIVEDTFDPDHAIELLDRYADEIKPYVEADHKRFYGDNYSLETFDEEIEDMRKFFRERAGYIVPYVEEACR